MANYTAKIYLRWFLGLYYKSGRKRKVDAIQLLENSKKLHEEALAIYEKLHGKEHKFYLGTAETYATVLYHLGQDDLALKLCTDALRVYRSSGHIAWPRIACTLADIYLDKEYYKVAKRLVQEAIKGNENFQVDDQNPRAWLPHVRLATVLIHTGEEIKGMKLLEKCINIWKENGLKQDHYWIARAWNTLEQCRASLIPCAV